MMEFGDKTVYFDGPKIMGVINMTPDSFSDGGKYSSIESALLKVDKMVNSGATFIDVGGESTRPGAKEVSVDEELSRVIPLIKAIDTEFDTIISIDTSKSAVMKKAVEAGATLINDTRALSMPNALKTAAELANTKNIPTCIMHMQGTPQTMQNEPSYDSVVEEVLEFFRIQINRLTSHGFRYKQIMLDPGFGFGKSIDHNYQLLKHFSTFTQFDLPVLAGMSRKSMIGSLLNKSIQERTYGDVATNTIAAIHGAAVLRVHEVEAVMDAVKIVDKINGVE